MRGFNMLKPCRVHAGGEAADLRWRRNRMCAKKRAGFSGSRSTCAALARRRTLELQGLAALGSRHGFCLRIEE
jgi:hypothetical protein